MLNDIIEEMRAKRSERLPMTFTAEEVLEVLAALEAKPAAVVYDSAVFESAERKKSAAEKKGQ